MSKTFDLVVVGGGILGTFAAYHALKLGKRVALLDRYGTTFNASARNFGQIVPSGLNSQWRPYGWKSLEIYTELQKIGDFSVRQNGSVYVASDVDELSLIHELYDLTSDDQQAPKLLTSAEACQRWNGLKNSYCRGGLFFPDEISVDPRRMVDLVQVYLMEKHQLSFYPKTIVQSIENVSDGGYKKVRTNTGLTLFGEQILICAGADYQHLFPDVYTAEDLTAVKVHMLMTKPQPSQRLHGNILTGLSIRRYEAFHECPSFATIKAKNDQDPRVAQWGIHILFKQTDDGHVIIGDAHHYARADEQERLGFEIEEEVKDYILELAREIFTLETYQVHSSWYGIYNQGVEQPVYSIQPANGIHILNAIGGKGMTAGPGFTYSFIHKIFDYD